VSSARPGNHLLVLNKGEATLAVIEPNSGATTRRAATGVGPHELAVSADGRYAVVADYGEQTPGHTLTVYDMELERVTATIDLAPHTRPHGIAFLDQRSTVLVTSETSKALLEVDLRGRKVVRVIPTGGDVSHMLALSPDRKRAYTSNMLSGTVSAIDLESGELVRSVPTGARPEAIAVSPDGREVWVGHNESNDLAILDARTLEELGRVACGPRPIRVEITPDGEHVLVSTLDSGELAVLDRRSRLEIARIALAPDADAGLNPAPVGIEIEPRGRFAYVALAGADRIAVVDLETWELRGHYATGKHPDGMAWSSVPRFPGKSIDG
jgi:YVTN family beta-propeller protein